MHSRATSTRSKCGRTFDLPFRQKRSHDVLSHSAIHGYQSGIRFSIQSVYVLWCITSGPEEFHAIFLPSYKPLQLEQILKITTHSVVRSSSAETISYVTPRLRTTFGNRAFSFTSPAIWNSLPVDLRSISDNANLKIKQLTFNIHSYFIY